MTNNARFDARRFFLGTVLPIAMIGLAVVPLHLFQERLPDPLATHWGTQRPNGSMSFDFLVAFQLVFSGVPAGVMAITARRMPAFRGEIAGIIGVTAFISATSTAISWLIVRANLDVENWQQAGFVGLTDLALVFGAAGLVAAIAVVFARTLETAEPPEPVVPRGGHVPGVNASWVGTARSIWGLPLVVGFFAIGFTSAVNQRPIMGLLLALAGLTGLAFTSIRVMVDRRGVKIKYGALGWPRQLIPLKKIRRAAVVNVVPLQRGGWGYRGSLNLFRRAAIVLRGGEGIELDLVGDRVLTITVDAAAEGAGLINDLLATPTSSSFP